jgi:hypothetical protein
MSKFRRFPFRCRACSRRYYQYVPADGEEVETGPESESDPEETEARDHREG